MRKYCYFIFVALIAIETLLPCFCVASAFPQHFSHSTVQESSQANHSDEQSSDENAPADPSDEDTVEEFISMEEKLLKNSGMLPHLPIPMLGTFCLANESPIADPYTRGLHRPPDFL